MINVLRFWRFGDAYLLAIILLNNNAKTIIIIINLYKTERTLSILKRCKANKLERKNKMKLKKKLFNKSLF